LAEDRYASKMNPPKNIGDYLGKRWVTRTQLDKMGVTLIKEDNSNNTVKVKDLSGEYLLKHLNNGPNLGERYKVQKKYKK